MATSAAAARRAANAAQANAVLRKFVEQQNARNQQAGLKYMDQHVRRDGSIDQTPSAAAGLQAQTSANGTTLMWHAAQDDHAVAGYNIYRDGQKIAHVTDATWFVDKAGTQPHDYEVRAVDDSGGEGSAAVQPLKQLALQKMQQQQAAGQQNAQTAKAAAQSQQQAQQGQQQGAAPAQGSQQQGKAPAAKQAAGKQAAPATGGGNLGAPQYEGIKSDGGTGFQLVWKPVQGAVAYAIFQDGKLIGYAQDTSFAANITKGAPTTIEVAAVGPDKKPGKRGPKVEMRIGAKGLEVKAPNMTKQ